MGGVLWLFSFKADLRNQVDYITATKNISPSVVRAEGAVSLCEWFVSP